VIFGDDVIVAAVTTPFTHSSKAVIKIGSRSFVNGARFGCAQEITVGEDCILADVRIMDTDFHAVHNRRNQAGMEPEVRPVRIGDNVWISAGSAVLKGVEIGRDSVVAFGSVVVKSLPSGKICGGNPAKEISNVPDGPSGTDGGAR
jgi:acetyltransferase-like isoleucine patch superfamily enzyme